MSLRGASRAFRLLLRLSRRARLLRRLFRKDRRGRFRERMEKLSEYLKSVRRGVGVSLRVEGTEKVYRMLDRIEDFPYQIPFNRRVQNAIAYEFLQSLRQHAPVRTGRLRSSIVLLRKGPTIEFGMEEYGIYVDQGTRPHMIFPRRAKVLRFIPEGEAEPVFARYVKHPGIQPTYWIGRATKTAKERLRFRLQQIIKQELRKNLRPI